MKTRKIQALCSALLFLISMGVPYQAQAAAKRRGHPAGSEPAAPHEMETGC